MEWPYLNADTFQLFVDAFAQAFPDRLNILLLDNSGAHTAQRIRWPAHVQPVWLPPYCPELNPIERVWRDVKDDLAWQQFVDLAAQQVYVGDLLQAYNASYAPGAHRLCLLIGSHSCTGVIAKSS